MKHHSTNDMCEAGCMDLGIWFEIERWNLFLNYRYPTKIWKDLQRSI